MRFNNPIPRSGTPKFHESSALRSLNDNDSVSKSWQRSRDISVLLNGTMKAVLKLQRQMDRLRRRVPEAEPEPGFTWAIPMEYDSSKAYSKNKVVVVSPDNLAVTTGASDIGGDPETGGIITGKDGTPSETGGVDSEDIATAGIWCCLKNPKVLSQVQPSDPNAPRNYDVHLPTWPPPSYIPADPDAEPPILESLNLTILNESGKRINNPLNYWMLIGLLPVERTLCDADGPNQHFVQEVQIPEPPEDEGE